MCVRRAHGRGPRGRPFGRKGGDVRKVSVVRREGIYSCFPDLVGCEDELICVYRQSDSHGARDFSHIALIYSHDRGETWGKELVLVRSFREGDLLFKWNCPRIGRLSDGRFWVLCDGYPQPPGEADHGRSRVFLWWSEDGRSWDGPHKTPVTGIVPDKLVELPSGTWLLAAHLRSPRTGKLMQTVWRSEDGGNTWDGPITVCEDPRYNSCEASILPLPDGTLVCYMRENSGMGWPGLKCISHDEGRTWEGPYFTLIPGCHRPASGLLPDGRVLVTYRWYLGGRSPNRHFYAYLEPASSALATELSEQEGTVREVDYDRSPTPDTGYSGWAVLSDGRIFCVNYIVDDWPSAQIRGYWLEEDFLGG
ncbi:MAG: exo-alpha-sialidase [Candidatus Latescibacterota bacterium]|nr:MAG: exo-alpha-sialidase [Candidatus Latescibacterota bacterium]